MFTYSYYVDSDVDDCELLTLLLELFALLSLVLETDEDELDEPDESLELLELDKLDELLDDKDEPPLLLSDELLLDSSGMSVHVAQHSIENERRRTDPPSMVSAAVDGPASFAPYTVRPTTVLR
jgi:hypothetical protein